MYDNIKLAIANFMQRNGWLKLTSILQGGSDHDSEWLYPSTFRSDVHCCNPGRLFVAEALPEGKFCEFLFLISITFLFPFPSLFFCRPTALGRLLFYAWAGRQMQKDSWR